MAEIFVCRPGAITDEDRAVLREAGVVVVQMDDTSDFKLIRAQVQPDFSAGELLKAAVTALSPDNDAPYGDAHRNRAKFFKALAKSLAAPSESDGEKS